MSKFLRTIRFDASDGHVFPRAAAGDEWAVSGAFAFGEHTAHTLTGKLRQAFANGFLGVESFGFSTFATVGEADALILATIEDRLVANLVSVFGAPTREAALPVARGEMAFIDALCRDVAINTVFTVRRTFDVAGAIKEEFRTIRPPTDGLMHAKIWAVDNEA
jgi:hypothetical protein